MAANRPDYILIIVISILIILGILILSSASAVISQERFGNPYSFLNHQIFFGIIPGIVLFLIARQIPTDFLKKIVPLLLLINLILAAMVFLPKVGVTAGGATRWLSLGGNITFQPSEFLKLTSVLYLASFLTSRTSHRKTSWIAKKSALEFSRTLIAFLIVIGLMALLLILQPDISTLGIIVVVGFLIYFLAGTPFWHSLLMMAMGFSALVSLIKLAPYRMQRWLVFLNPETDPLGIGYQIKQSLIAIGSGGILGLGLGMSRQKFGFLPQSMTDSIFAIFTEETGFLGSLILISLFLIILWQGFKISLQAKDKFLQLTGMGITSWICLQAFLNVGAMIGIVPLAGIPLPFISYGGSHMVAELAGMGILLNISRKSI